MKPGLRSSWLLIFMCLPCLDIAAAWQGRPVAELLEELTGQGYRIIYSSDVVTDELLIREEPDLSDPLSGLAAVLESHHLELSKGPAGTWLVRAQHTGPVAAAAPTRAEIPLPEIIVTSSLHRLQYAQSGKRRTSIGNWRHAFRLRLRRPYALQAGSLARPAAESRAAITFAVAK